jgi:tRNA pseudouridine38-40 synthase
MSARLKLTVAYDGSAFAGWQSQTHRNTVQDELERALHKITAHRVRVHGAGRTDSGVHAIAQCAHVDLVERKLSATGWRKALNGVLPPTIRILMSRYVAPADFHARFSAKGKTYRYRIWTGSVMPPFELNRAWHRPSIDVGLLTVAGRKFVGRHDFAGFAANRGKKEENTVRTIRSLQIKKRGSVVTIEITGDGFLYKMVRLIVGTMVRVGLKKMDSREIDRRLKSARMGSAHFSAPGEGLYLVKVWY